ncbi:GntR family transcriptional regulator [Aurantimonas endophytica]|uniref:DNA-binding GntR family transcriptional regulator n=1 Tax=Aurantimonas endophytica TaxID=1522175 RepID=A0A7W6MQ43_9HYPH|nr:GntR family transcriptional regulator [Aurantimonas endophytica]MBB4003542.1 DNA-binding GntR family transcriptional regulator [Aurantimonas endophytica]MCO6404401.1 FCD domain-containing protein [Aurantimonas endophytica]
MSDAAALFETDSVERKPPLVEAAYDALKQAIRDGMFPPGFQGSELEMAHRLGMSRTPVHQAIIRLQSEGMVELRPKRGVVIRSLSPDDMREVYDVIIAVEGMAALLLAEQPAAARQAVCDDLEAMNEELIEALDRDDLARWADVDARFHAVLVEGSGNSRLAKIARINIDQSYRARRLTLRFRPKPVHSIGEHRLIIAAAREGDAAGARQMAQDHKIKARDLIVALLKRYDMKHL